VSPSTPASASTAVVVKTALPRVVAHFENRGWQRLSATDVRPTSYPVTASSTGSAAWRVCQRSARASVGEPNALPTPTST
jgi:hypothetical protein